VVEAGVIPRWLLQKYLNKWISSSFDLFGTDHSSSAHWAYVWGIKGRYDELQNDKAADLDDLNDYSRHLYRQEVAGLVERLNTFLQPGEKNFYTPDIHFNRSIGKMGGEEVSLREPANHWTIAAYEQHCEENLPSAKDKAFLLDIIRNEKKWIKEKAGARDPLSTITEPRKSGN
jgi:benzoyl-CoA 2,3-epoxidase subunit B